MDEKIKTWPLRFPAKETLIWRRHCSIGQSCCSMTSKKFLESSSGMKFVYPSVRLANQNPGAFVSVSYTNQIALFPFVCCFCFVRAFSFQDHTKIALTATTLSSQLSQFFLINCEIFGEKKSAQNDGSHVLPLSSLSFPISLIISSSGFSSVFLTLSTARLAVTSPFIIFFKNAAASFWLSRLRFKAMKHLERKTAESIGHFHRVCTLFNFKFDDFP